MNGYGYSIRLTPACPAAILLRAAGIGPMEAFSDAVGSEDLRLTAGGRGPERERKRARLARAVVAPIAFESIAVELTPELEEPEAEVPDIETKQVATDVSAEVIDAGHSEHEPVPAESEAQTEKATIASAAAKSAAEIVKNILRCKAGYAVLFHVSGHDAGEYPSQIRREQVRLNASEEWYLQHALVAHFERLLKFERNLEQPVEVVRIPRAASLGAPALHPSEHLPGYLLGVVYHDLLELPRVVSKRCANHLVQIP